MQPGSAPRDGQNRGRNTLVAVVLALLLLFLFGGSFVLGRQSVAAGLDATADSGAQNLASTASSATAQPNTTNVVQKTSNSSSGSGGSGNSGGNGGGSSGSGGSSGGSRGSSGSGNSGGGKQQRWETTAVAEDQYACAHTHAFTNVLSLVVADQERLPPPLLRTVSFGHEPSTQLPEVVSGLTTRCGAGASVAVGAGASTGA